MARKKRTYDVVVWGATGFTGRLVAEHLFQTYGVGKKLKWAMAGRNEQKLRAARASIGDETGNIPFIIADGNSVDDMKHLAELTKVVATTVGPYVLYGGELVAACARAGTHYCDLAGEVPWMRRMIDAHSVTAERSGARIVHCCGFDSIPSDLGVWMMQQASEETFGQSLQKIHFYLAGTSGRLSGGTAASMMEIVSEAQKNLRTAKLLADPYALNPKDARSGDDQNEQFIPHRDEMLGQWVAPFVMASVNTRVVRRTNALLDYPYGKDFRYQEWTLCGDGAAGMAKSVAITAATGAFVAGAAIPPSRFVMRKLLLPKPGSGPDAEQRANGYFTIRFAGMTRDGDMLTGTLKGERDPGYGCTSRMLGEAAVCLSKTKSTAGKGGFSTPMAAMSDTLPNRLMKHAGLQFSVDESA
ncbi:MAG: saccharopine dehydrogenase NADP-binding domain-containing protein [Pseudomonadota bacterium]